MKKWGINNARLSLTAENVAIIKSKNTLAADPSNVSPDGYYTGNGYGLPRKFTIGLMFDFKFEKYEKDNNNVCNEYTAGVVLM